MSDKWQITNKPNSTFIYKLNKNGTNEFDCALNPGFDDNGNRTSDERLHEVAKKMRAADELFEELYKLLDSLGAMSNPYELSGWGYSEEETIRVVNLVRGLSDE